MVGSRRGWAWSPCAVPTHNRMGRPLTFDDNCLYAQRVLSCAAGARAIRVLAERCSQTEHSPDFFFVLTLYISISKSESNYFFCCHVGRKISATRSSFSFSASGPLRRTRARHDSRSSSEVSRLSIVQPPPEQAGRRRW